MAIVSVMYPAKAGSRFDMNYYLNTHMKMVEASWSPAGLRGYTVLQGIDTGDGNGPAFQVMVNMDFTSAEAFGAAVAETGEKIMGDVPNFTDLQPTVQISEVASSFPARN